MRPKQIEIKDTAEEWRKTSKKWASITINLFNNGIANSKIEKDSSASEISTTMLNMSVLPS